MASIALFQKVEALATIGQRGHHVIYRAEESNRCPGCGRANWYVGRATAECGFCGTAIALAEVNVTPSGRLAVRGLGTSTSAEKVAGADRRRHPRIKATGKALELLIDGSPHAFVLENISADGLMGSDPVGLIPHAQLQVRFPDGMMVPAEVKWTDGGLVGLALSTPVGLRLAQRA